MHVHSSVSGCRDLGLKWLKPRCVCADVYGDSNRPRHDDILLKSGNQIVFAKLLVLFTLRFGGLLHELCYVRLYESVSEDFHPILGELYLGLGDECKLYPDLEMRIHPYLRPNNCAHAFSFI